LPKLSNPLKVSSKTNIISAYKTTFDNDSKSPTFLDKVKK